MTDTMTMPVKVKQESETGEFNLQSVVTKNIRVALALHDANQRDLAAALDMHPSAVSQKMTGRVDWSLTDIAKAAHFFSVRPERLVAGSGFEPETSGLLTQRPQVQNRRERGTFILAA